MGNFFIPIIKEGKGRIGCSGRRKNGGSILIRSHDLAVCETQSLLTHTCEERMTSSSRKVYITEQCITHFARPLYVSDRSAYLTRDFFFAGIENISKRRCLHKTFKNFRRIQISLLSADFYDEFIESIFFSVKNS